MCPYIFSFENSADPDPESFQKKHWVIVWFYIPVHSYGHVETVSKPTLSLGKVID